MDGRGRLDIPFGPNPFMEVDILCESKRLAVEIGYTRPSASMRLAMVAS